MKRTISYNLGTENNIMKLIISLLLISTLANAVPLYENDERYFWFPDDDGVLRLVDSWDEIITRFSPEEDIKYYLYTRSNPTTYQEIKKGDVNSLLATNFNISKPVKFTIHGWESDYTSATNILVRNAFLSIDDVNVITVDWGVGAAGGYLSSVQHTLSSGPSVAEFLNWLNELGVPFSNMHLIGHSLGGQMVGIVGRNANGVVEYITSMDPANPMWGASSQRVTKEDGKYVEIIHTNIGLLGMTDATGHNDFYPNGGRYMPGCDTDVNCAHSRARNYFAESVATGGFTSVQCATVAEASAGVDSCTGNTTIQMGGPNIKPEYGLFALNTNAASPFSQG